MDCDVLNLEWSSGGRDRETASLIAGTLRRHGYTVVEESVFQYRAALARHRPRVLYLADPRGAAINHNAALFARSRGIPIFTVTAEGNFNEGQIAELFWGHVSGEELIEDVNVQWSVRARDLALGIDRRMADRLKVAGGVGFDRYLLYDLTSKEAWMAKHGLRFERMVGYASWVFDVLERNDPGAVEFRELSGPDAVARFKEDRRDVRAMLGRLAEDNPDTLFLIKQHPGVVVPADTEIAGLNAHPNVMVMRDEEPVADCISACDAWTAFDSTTCLEAWLLGKPTLLINPSGEDFDRTESYRGSPVASSLPEVQSAFDSWFSEGTLPGFEERAEARRDEIERAIQWDDGRNHLRAAHYLEELLERAPAPAARSLRDRAQGLVQGTLYRGASTLPWMPLFRGFTPARERFREDELASVTRRAAEALERFDPEHELTEADLRELDEINMVTLPR